MRLRPFCVASAILLAGFGPASCQQLLPIAPQPGVPRGGGSGDRACTADRLLTDKSLTFEQKSCYYGHKLISPGMALHAAFSAGFGQMRGTPELPQDGMSDLGRRFAIFYAQHGAQRAGELLGGLLYHEDPRPHSSKQEHFWDRTRSALLSVVVTQNGDGASRPALAPIAGAFGAGFVGMASYRHHNSWGDGFRFAGVSYSGYFAKALAHEFHPDISTFAERFLHHHKLN